VFGQAKRYLCCTPTLFYARSQRLANLHWQAQRNFVFATRNTQPYVLNVRADAEEELIARQLAFERDS